MKQKPKISVIVCAYNEERSIVSCMRSLLNQGGVGDDDYEIIVVDDESTDRTAARMNQFMENNRRCSPLVKFIRIKHKGLSVARNVGVLNSVADVVAFVDADAEAQTDWLAALLRGWKNHRSEEIIGGRIVIRNHESCFARYIDDVLYRPMDDNGIIGANMSFRKESLLRAGLFGFPFTSRGDENYMLWKMGYATQGLTKIDDAVVYHDRPATLREWLRERIAGGRMNALRMQLCSDVRKKLHFFIFKRVLSLVVIFICMTFALGRFLVPFVVLLWLGYRYRSWHRALRESYANCHRALPRFWQGISWLLLEQVGHYFIIYGIMKNRVALSTEQIAQAEKADMGDVEIIEVLCS